MYKKEGIEINRINHSCFKISYTKIIYTDPFKIENNLEPADIILISHEHFDHCSPEDIAKILKNDTLIICTPDCLSKLSRLDKGRTAVMRPGEKLKVSELVEIEAVPAYNINKKFHPKENEWVGYVISLGSRRIYFAGDTDFIPEMKELKNIEVALMPVSGMYVMTAEEAANAVNSFRPKMAIPMHYGGSIGKEDDAQRFKKLAKVEVVILEK